MDNITGNRWTRWIIAVLVVLNILLLASFWYSRFKPAGETVTTGKSRETGDTKPLRPDGKRPDDSARKEQDQRLAGYLKREMNYSDRQVEQFLKLREEHHTKMQVLNQQMNNARRRMMDMLLEENHDPEQVATLAAQIGDSLSKIEQSTFKHFLDLMKIGDQQQRGKYKQFLREIIRQLKPPQQGPPHRQDEQDRERRLGPPPKGHRPPPPQRRGPPPNRTKDRKQRS